MEKSNASSSDENEDDDWLLNFEREEIIETLKDHEI
jgi:hypothetical protein